MFYHRRLISHVFFGKLGYFKSDWSKLKKQLN